MHRSRSPMSPSWCGRGWRATGRGSGRAPPVSPRRPRKGFAVVTVPLLMPALVSGWLLAFTLSLDDVVVASFTSGPGASTLPMVVFSATRLGVTPEIYALATVIVAVVSCVLLL